MGILEARDSSRAQNSIEPGFPVLRSHRLAKIVFWRLPGGARSAKIVFWRVLEEVWPGDECLRRAQQPPGGNPQKHSFPLVLHYFKYSRPRDSLRVQDPSQPSFPEPRSSLHAGGPGPQRIYFDFPRSSKCCSWPLCLIANMCKSWYQHFIKNVRWGALDSGSAPHLQDWSPG